MTGTPLRTREMMVTRVMMETPLLVLAIRRSRIFHQDKERPGNAAEKVLVFTYAFLTSMTNMIR